MENDITFGDLVKVTWADAHGSAANVAYDIDEIPHAAIEVESYGILLKQDMVGVSIASERCDETTYRGYSFIPAGMLISVTRVRTKGRKRKPPALSSKAASPPLTKLLQVF